MLIKWKDYLKKKKKKLLKRRSEETWPIPDAVIRKFYLHSGGMANTFLGNGQLSTILPKKEENPDHYESDPSNPINSIGGHSLLGGSVDQRINEIRKDVLVYTSLELKEDLVFIGYGNATIYESTSETDTDFFIKIIDLTLEGKAYNVTQCGRRRRYLKNGRTSPEALTPGKIEKWCIELYATGYVVKKGHKIRVEISCNDFINREINPNQFMDLSKVTKKDYIIAKQTIYHDEDDPSMIKLPVFPAEYKRVYIEWPFGDGEDSMNMQVEAKWNKENKQVQSKNLMENC